MAEMMRAVTFVENNKVEVQEKPVPEIESDQVLLKVGGAGLCHSDLSIINMGNDSPLRGGTLGHETAGMIAELGSKVSDSWNIGDQAVVHLVVSCGVCAECLAGRDHQCVEANQGPIPMSYGIGQPGGMADYMAVNARHLVKLDDVNLVEAAPFADAGLTPMHAINSVRDRLTPESTVVVSGLGGLGHVGLQIVLATTGGRVVALDTDRAKVDYASEQGAIGMKSDDSAADKIREMTGGIGADVVHDFVGVQPTVDIATAAIRNGGAIRFVGLGRGEFPYIAGDTKVLPWNVNIELPYTGTLTDLRQVVALARQDKLRVEVEQYSLDDAVTAFDDLANGRIQGRAVLVP